MSHPRALLGAVLTLAALAAAGCGSSSTKDDKTPVSTVTTTVAKPAAKAAAPAPAPTTAGPRPTKATYVRRADEVCREARDVSRDANTVVQKAFAANDLNRAAEAIDNYTPLFAKHVDELKALRRPADSAKVLTGLMKVMDGQVQALRDEASALRQQDDATLQQISKAQQTELQFADQLGKAYGFKVCGRAA
ncbi:MAG TPA: hypothetical protein VI318_00620 [Baekduia sp.]